MLAKKRVKVAGVINNCPRYLFVDMLNRVYSTYMERKIPGGTEYYFHTYPSTYETVEVKVGTWRRKTATFYV